MLDSGGVWVWMGEMGEEKASRRRDAAWCGE